MTVRTGGDVYEGSRIVVECEFRLNGVPTDPLVVQVDVRRPSGSQSTINYPDSELVRVSPGLYNAYVTVDDGGTWWFRIGGFGGIDAVTEKSLEVVPSQFVL
jgi:hypothetical protein